MTMIRYSIGLLPTRRTTQLSCTLLTLLHFLGTGCAPGAREAWIGIDLRPGHAVAGSQPASAPAPPADRRVDFQLVRQLGASLVRANIMNWAAAQPVAGGAYDFSMPDRFVRMAQQNNIDLLAVCGGIPVWATADPPAAVPARDKSEAFAAFVQAFVDRYDGDGRRDMPGLRKPIRDFECLQEMEDVPPAEYAAWLRLFHDIVRKTDPKARVVLGSLRTPGLNTPDQAKDYSTYFERLLADPALQGPAYPCFDVVAFHNFPRRYPGRPAFEHAVAYLRQAMAAHHFDRPIWLTAFGADSNAPNARGDDRQAADLVCWTIHARTLGIERMYIHTLRDEPPGTDAGAAGCFGLVRDVPGGGQPPTKPAFEAVTMLLSTLGDYSQITRRAAGIYMLSGHKEPTYVLWRVARYDPSSFLIPGWWEVRTLSGQRFIRQGSDIKLTDQPIFLKPTTSPFIR
ncbi:MAG TPA: beta-galactosidase [Phycisphaerae bacterium]|nr:beta-galactosidase [Phycisphaerae bacterium]